MDAFISSGSVLASQLLPIAGLIVLILLIVVLSRMIKTLHKVNDILDNCNDTIDLVDQSIDKLQGPLNTADKLAKGVEKGYEASITALKNTGEYIASNKNIIRDKTSELIDKAKSLYPKKEPKTPGPEDIIGG